MYTPSCLGIFCESPPDSFREAWASRASSTTLPYLYLEKANTIPLSVLSFRSHRLMARFAMVRFFWPSFTLVSQCSFQGRHKFCGHRTQVCKDVGRSRYHSGRRILEKLSQGRGLRPGMTANLAGWSYIYTLEPFDDVSPIKDGDFPVSC